MIRFPPIFCDMKLGAILGNDKKSYLTIICNMYLFQRYLMVIRLVNHKIASYLMIFLTLK